MKLGNALLLTAAFVGGYVIGHNKTTKNDYKIMEKQEKTILYSKELDKGHEINQIGNDFYMGSTDHNIKGAKELIKYDPQNTITMKTYSRLKTISELEEKIFNKGD